MFKLLVLIGLLALANGQGDLDSVIQQIFGPNAGNGSKPAISPNPSGTVTDLSSAGTNAGGTGTNTGGTGTNTGGTGTNTGGTGINTGGGMPLPSTIVPPVVKPNIDSSAPEPCTTDTSLVGECVRYYQCNDNNTFNEDGTGLIDIRVRDGPCASYLDTCCLPANTRPNTDPILPTPKPETVRMGCGWRNPIGVGFHTKGDVDGEAKFGEFPWMVAILKVEPVNENQPDGQKLNVYVGGGSLIHPSVVLTAAHYVSALKQLKVRVGEWDTQTKNEIYPHQDRDVTEVVIHKDYNKGNLFYDVALLFLSAPVDPAPHIGTACLPPAGARAIPGALCYASGWGKDSFGKEGRYQVILKRVEVPVVERNKCQGALRRTRLGMHFQLHVSFMCAGGERGKDTCKGDGGSPLVCPIEYEQDRYVQNGIVAWGIGCGQDGTPGVYADVSVVRGWIDNMVTGRGFDPATYTYYNGLNNNNNKK